MQTSHPKSPESKDDDDEVDDVGEEHESVDVSSSPILCMEDTPEETFGWPGNSLNPGGEFVGAIDCLVHTKAFNVYDYNMPR